MIRPDGSLCEPGETGEIAVKRPDPVMFLGYWDRPDATREKFIGDWMTTGDQGVMDGDGYLTFVGRDDDVITSSGYRIGPAEIEDCLIRHPAVSRSPPWSASRTRCAPKSSRPSWCSSPAYAASDALAADIRDFVKQRLSAHEYPREVAFIDAMPMTTTGKVIRRLLRERG